MFTRCPSCREAFSISDQQLEIAAGMVRCGMCEHVFDARLYLFDQPRDDMYESVDVVLEEDTTAIDIEFLDRELQGTHPHIPKSPRPNLPSAFDAAVHKGPPEEDPVEDRQATEEPVVPKVIAEEVSKLDSESHNIYWGRWLAGFTGLLLLAALALQITAFIQPQLIPQRYQTTLCRWLKCSPKVPRAVDKIEVLNRSIYTHPTRKQALMVTVTIINKADFAQPYPIIKLRFLNVSGEVIAARQFAANHYLKNKPTQGQLMETDIPLSIKLEVYDVGEEVVSYDFDFL